MTIKSDILYAVLDKRGDKVSTTGRGGKAFYKTLAGANKKVESWGKDYCRVVKVTFEEIEDEEIT